MLMWGMELPTRAWVITPSDVNLAASGVTNAPYARVIRASAACTLKVTMIGGDVVTIPFAAGDNAGGVLQVWSTGSVLNGATLAGLY